MNKLTKIIFKKLSIIILFYTPNLLAECNFKTGEYINKLSQPSSIKKIELKIPNNRGYIINFARIIKSSGYVPDNLKKSFKATIKVYYPFGECFYTGKVRQHGDGKDHTYFRNRKPYRSLNVRLEEGNIMNAVGFKLFLPQSRNNKNEVLGTLILKELGFIVPETFQVLVSINNSEGIMLFQESARKEMLERNKRREGPIFEGDETLLMGNSKKFEGMGPIELEDISLARLSNWRYLLKGENHKFITLNSFSKLQNHFLKYVSQSDLVKNNLRNNFNLFAGENIQPIFRDYQFALLIMNGQHGLRPHNRKFFYNSLTSSLEPIYYDGNLNLIKDFESSENNNDKNYPGIFDKKYIFNGIQKLNKINLNSQIFYEFKSRILDFDTNDEKYFLSSIEKIISNSSKLKKSISLNQYPTPKKREKQDNINKYISSTKFHNIFQTHLKSIIPETNNNLIESYSGEMFNINDLELASLLSNFTISKDKKRFEENRFVFINNKKIPELPLINYQLNSKGGKDSILNIFYIKGIGLDVNEKNKTINITQNNKNNWVIIKDSKLEDWEINFKGINNELSNYKFERINKYGHTGCLNIFNSNFKKTSINVKGGDCEDSLNIINSIGDIKNINILNSFSDGIDSDFSELEIASLIVKNAGNDCLDLSRGKYKIKFTSLDFCKDKAISIGEKSTLKLNNGDIKNSKIGISVKDFSTLNADKLTIRNSEICVESYMKKQEFGGGKAVIEEYNCDGIFNEDINSKIDF